MSPLKTLVAGAIALTVTAAHAEPLDVFGGKLTTTASLASDYVFRGFSQNDENFAPMLTSTWAHQSGLHVDLFAAPVDFDAGSDDARFEVDATVGYTHAFNDKLTGDVSAVAYTYPGASGGYKYDYYEAVASLAYDLEVAKIGGQLAYSPNFTGVNTRDGVFAEGNMTAPLTVLGHDFTTTAGYGRQMVENGVNYNTWRAGVSYDLKGFVLGVNYYDTNIGSDQCNDLCSARAVVSVAHAF